MSKTTGYVSASKLAQTRESRDKWEREAASLKLKLKTRDKLIKDLIEERDRALATKPADTEYVPRRTWND